MVKHLFCFYYFLQYAKQKIHYFVENNYVERSVRVVERIGVRTQNGEAVRQTGSLSMTRCYFRSSSFVHIHLYYILSYIYNIIVVAMKSKIGCPPTEISNENVKNINHVC